MSPSSSTRMYSLDLPSLSWLRQEGVTGPVLSRGVPQRTQRGSDARFQVLQFGHLMKDKLLIGFYS